jgi:hypothetical protein
LRGEAAHVQPAERVTFAAGRPCARRPDLWLEDPRNTYDRKVIISDTDHYAPRRATTLGLKSFLCDHHSIQLNFGSSTA